MAKEDQAEAEDIRSALAAAIDGAEQAAVEPAEIPDKPEVAAEAPAAEVDGDQGSKDEVKEPAAPVEEADKAPELPKEVAATWSKPDREMFAKAGKDVQEFLLRRHRDMETDYQKKREADSAVRRDYEQISGIFAPYKQQMQAQGLTLPGIINAWAAVEQQLMKGDGDKVVAALVQNYKIEPAKVLKALGLDGQPKQPEPQFDPQVDAALQAKFNAILAPFQQKVDTVFQTLSAQQEAAQKAQERQVADTVSGFVNAKDAAGNLLHPHFEAVSPLMVQLATAERQAGRQPDLEQIYQQAVWATPQTREQLLATEKAAQEAKVREAARAKAATAKKASVQVTGSPAGQTPRVIPSGDKPLRETLGDIYEQVVTNTAA